MKCAGMGEELKSKVSADIRETLKSSQRSELSIVGTSQAKNKLNELNDVLPIKLVSGASDTVEEFRIRFKEVFMSYICTQWGYEP